MFLLVSVRHVGAHPDEDFICRIVLILIFIYFEWRDPENQQLKCFTYKKDFFKDHYTNFVS